MTNSFQERKALPMKAEILVVHRQPMLLVDSLIRREGDCASAKALTPSSGICYEAEFGFPEFYIEIVAQAIALASGYDAICAGKELNGGMLVGIDSFSFHEPVPPGTFLSIEVEKTFEFGAVKIIQGQVFHNDTLLAEGKIKVWEDLGQEEM